MAVRPVPLSTWVHARPRHGAEIMSRDGVQGGMACSGGCTGTVPVSPLMSAWSNSFVLVCHLSLEGGSNLIQFLLTPVDLAPLSKHPARRPNSVLCIPPFPVSPRS